MYNYDTIITLIINIVIPVIISTIIFYNIQERLTEKTLKNQVDIQIDDVINILFGKLPHDSRHKITLQINNIISEDIKIKDNNAIKHDTSIKQTMYIILGILLLVSISIICILYYNSSRDTGELKSLIVKIVLYTIIVFSVKTIYLYLISRNYISNDAYEIRKNIINKLYKSSQDCSNSVPKSCNIFQ